MKYFLYLRDVYFFVIFPSHISYIIPKLHNTLSIPNTYTGTFSVYTKEKYPMHTQVPLLNFYVLFFVWIASVANSSLKHISIVDCKHIL